MLGLIKLLKSPEGNFSFKRHVFRQMTKTDKKEFGGTMVNVEDCHQLYALMLSNFKYYK